MVFAKTVPLTEADPLVALNVALAVVPGDAQGVPETPVQLVAVVFHVPLVALQIPSAADASGMQKAREEHQQRMRAACLARKCSGDVTREGCLTNEIFAHRIN